MRTIAIALCLALAACASPVDIQVHCLPMVTYDAAQQALLAQEWAKLDPNSLTASKFIPDAIKMRDANRACAAPKSGK